MTTNGEFNFFTFIRILRRYAVHLAGWTMAGMVAGFFIYLAFPKKYGYTALLQVADVERLEAYLLGRALQRGGIDRIGETEHLAFEVESYLGFKYLQSLAFLSKKPALKMVRIQKPGDLIQIVTYGNSLDESKTLLQTIVDDLQTQFQSKIDDIKKYAQSRMQLITAQIAAEKKALKDIADAIHNIGYSAILLQEQQNITSQLITLETDYYKIEHGIAPQKIYDFRYLDVTPLEGGDAVFPKAIALVALFGFLFFVLALNTVILIELVKNAMIEAPTRKEPTLHDE